LRDLFGIVLAVSISTVGAAQAQYGARPHPIIYVCADDAKIAGQLQRRLPAAFSVIDGAAVSPPRQTSEVSLALFGRLGGAAERCAQQYPGGRAILDGLTSGAQGGAGALEGRLKKLGAEVVGGPMAVQTMTWDQKSGSSISWFAEVCFLPPREQCPDADGVNVLVEMANAD
jgi:hypothetical protein